METKLQKFVTTSIGDPPHRVLISNPVFVLVRRGIPRLHPITYVLGFKGSNRECVSTPCRIGALRLA